MASFTFVSSSYVDWKYLFLIVELTGGKLVGRRGKAVGIQDALV
jgi:hypothetical protein